MRWGPSALARIRLDEALADPTRTAAPAEQSGDFKDLPPAVILDVDETLLDTSLYQAWTVVDGQAFAPRPGRRSSTASPRGPSRCGRVRHVCRREGREGILRHQPHRRGGGRDAREHGGLGFPMGGNVDTLLTAKEKPDWGSAKGTRRAVIAKDYRILLLIGDNLGDFSDGYKGDEAARLKVYEDNADALGQGLDRDRQPHLRLVRIGPLRHDYKLPVEAQRAAKEKALEVWPGP